MKLTIKIGLLSLFLISLLFLSGCKQVPTEVIPIAQCNRCSTNAPALANDEVMCERDYSGFSCTVSGGCLKCTTGSVTPTCTDGRITSTCVCRGVTRTSGVCCDNGNEYQSNFNLICCDDGMIVSTQEQCEELMSKCTVGRTALCFGGGYKVCKADGTYGNCIFEKEECTDSDGSLSAFLVKGTATQGSESDTDFCIQGGIELFEAGCDSSGLTSFLKNCKDFGSNWVCENGRCVQKTIIVCNNNGICEGSETKSNCPNDCAIQPPEPEPEPTDPCFNVVCDAGYFCDLNGDCVSSSICGGKTCQAPKLLNSVTCECTDLSQPTTPKFDFNRFLKYWGIPIGIVLLLIIISIIVLLTRKKKRGRK